MRLSLIKIGLVGSVLLLGWVASPIAAETLEELDALSDLTVEEATGIAHARKQADEGALLEALATLERVLAVHPKSQEARILHAVLLCQIDDKRGGLVEIDKLKEKEFGAELLAEARSVCAVNTDDQGEQAQ